MAADQRILFLIEAMYSPTVSNERRQALVREVQEFELSGNGDVIGETALSLLSSNTVEPVVQAFGCVLLRNGLRNGKISPTVVPRKRLIDMLGRDSGRTAKVLQHNAIELVADVCVMLWPQSWSSMFEEVVSEQPYVACLGLQQCLDSIVRALLDPDRTKKRTTIIRKAFALCVPELLNRTIQCIFQKYEVIRQPTSGVCAEEIESVRVCLSVVVNLCSVVSCTTWSDCAVDRMLLALMELGQVSHDALCSAAMLLQESSLTTNECQHMLTFAATVLQKVELTVRAENWVLTAELIALAVNLRKETQRMLRDTLVNFCGFVLSVPSVMFAASAFEILLRVFDRFELPPGLADPTPLLSAISTIAPKFISHPQNASNSVSASFSQWQFSGVAEFEQHFAELRNHARALLELVAEISSCAEICMTFIYNTISNLVSEPFVDDARNSQNTVTQQSRTYVQWELCCFLVDGLSRTMSQPSVVSTVHSCASVLFDRANIISDPVVTPIFLNILLIFLKAQKVDEPHQIWRAGVDVLLRVLQLHVSTTEDVMSARKRSLTVLIDAAETHSGAIISTVPEVDQMLTFLLNNKVRRHAEKLLLTEALACLVNAAPPNKKELMLFQLTEQAKQVIVVSTAKLDSAYAIAGWLICAQPSSPHRSNLTSADGVCTYVPCKDGAKERQELKDAFATIAAVLRRCRDANLMSRLIFDISGEVVRFLHLMHQLTASVFPPQFSSTLSGRGDRKIQSNSAEEMAQLFYNWTREAVYQCVAELGKFADFGSFGSVFGRIVEGATFLSPINFRPLFHQCIAPLCRRIPQLLEIAAPAIAGFLTQNGVYSTKVGSTSGNNESEIADERILFFLSKDVLKLLNDLVVNPRGHTRDPAALNVAVTILLSLISCGADVKSAAVEVCAVADEVSDEDRTSILVHVMTCARNHVSRKHIFDTIVGAVGDAFLRRPVVGLLTAGGMTTSASAELVEVIAMTPLADARRKKIQEALKRMCA